MSYELLNRKLEEAQHGLLVLQGKHADILEEIEALRKANEQKDYLLEKMATKLLKFKEKVACIEIKLVKFRVQKPDTPGDVCVRNSVFVCFCTNVSWFIPYVDNIINC